MDFGELISRRQSQNIEDLRQPFATKDVTADNITIYNPNPIASTVEPWQATTRYEPQAGALGALTQSAKDYTRKKEIEEIIDALRLGMLMKQAREGTVPTMPPVPSK